MLVFPNHAGVVQPQEASVTWFGAEDCAMLDLLHCLPMQSVTNASFGPLIAYLVPGATVLFGVSRFSPTLRTWFAATPIDSPTIGGFLYLTLASLTAGMTITAVRWAVLDTVNGWTGLRLPPLDFSKLG